MKRFNLNPCKKCGYDRMRKTDHVDLGEYGFLIRCPKCRTKSDIGFSLSNAVERWNAENQEVTA